MASANYYSLAAYDVNAYVWQQIQSSGLLVASDYFVDSQGLSIVPIIPAQQIPEINNLLPGKTYLVYDFIGMPVSTAWWITKEVMTYQVMSTDVDKANAIVNLLVDLFQRYDDSAKSIAASGILSNDFIFHYTAIEHKTSPEPSKYEGGTTTGNLSILYEYSRNLDKYGRF